MITSVRHLSMKFGDYRALDDVNLDIGEGEFVAVLGPSGCGKTTLLRLLAGFFIPSAGTISMNGSVVAENGYGSSPNQRNIGMVFQSYALWPHMTVFQQILFPLRHSRIKTWTKKDMEERAMEMLCLVGMGHLAGRYPSELSGGQRQRVAIARALVTRPELVVCDEAVSALDASVQAQVLNLLKEVQADFGLTYFFISHDLSVVGYMSDRVAVMYLGRIVEQADRNTLFGSAAHPYTKALLAAAPVHDPAKRRIRAFLPGELPSPFSPPAGCAFHPRCPQAMPRCREEAPELREIAPDHLARCHLYG